MAEPGDRELILANFQAVTGIENLDECITLLQHHNWDLEASVNSVITDEVDSPVLPPRPERTDFEPPFVLGQSLQALQPRMTQNIRRCGFQIEWRDDTIPLSIEDNETVGTIKRMLEMQLGIPAEQMNLIGWDTNTNINDNTIISTLNLREETSLILLTPNVTTTPLDLRACASSSATPNGFTNSSISTRNLQSGGENVTLSIQCGKDKHKLNYPITKSIKEVKTDIFSLSKIEVRNQSWNGWPNSVKDDTTLGECKLDKPVHHLTVERSPSDSRHETKSTLRHDSEDMDGGSESDNEESFTVDDDDIFMADEIRRQITDMIPDNSVDNAEIMIKFREQFENRYGHQHPEFYLGSLPEAIEEANGASAMERKPLLIYLHHDASILTNVFCCQLLCAESIVTFISQNFLSWAWDMTHDSNKARFLNMANLHFGSGAANTVRGFGPEQFPLVLIVMKNKSAMEVATVMQGHITVDELMTGLISAHDVFQQAMDMEIREEAERDAREQVKREQDLAYEESLKADRAKAEEKQRMEEEAMMAKKQAEEQALHDAELKEAQRLSLEDQLPQEPGPECTDPVTILRFRLPGGEKLTRRFLANSILKSVLIYVQSSGYLENEYKIVTNFPRRELYNMDPNQSLQDAGLYPQETIFVEEC